MKSDIVYTDETLFVYLEGSMNKKSINTLRKKIYNIVDDYQINDVVIDLKNVRKKDKNFDLLLKEYQEIYNSEIKLKL